MDSLLIPTLPVILLVFSSLFSSSYFKNDFFL